MIFALNMVDFPSHVLPLTVHLRLFCLTCWGTILNFSYSLVSAPFAFGFRSYWTWMGMGLGLGGFGTKGLGPGLDNFYFPLLDNR